MPVAVAAPNTLAAEAGAAIARSGGSAVDVALAAVTVAMITEPGVCAPGAGGFVTVGSRQSPAHVFDGYLEVPGRAHTGPTNLRTIQSQYGGGMTTIVGPGSIATPGAFAAMERAARRHGRLDWATILTPAINIAREGFPLGETAHSYLEFVHDSVFGADAASRAILHDAQGRLHPPGSRIVIPDLADSLVALADGGSRELHLGSLGRAITADLTTRGSRLGQEDLAAFEVVERPALFVDIGGWRIGTNPLPAVGGVALAAMLAGLPDGPPSAADVVSAQRHVVEYRHSHVAPASDKGAAVADMARDLLGMHAPSTVHVSAADSDGLVCAVTMSAGYGSGVIPAGTGLWMNNGLGEVELTGGDPANLIAGVRLLSNMAPSVATGPDGQVVAVGSPGADRITTAILTTLLALITEGAGLAEAVDHPRLHVEWTDAGPRVAFEPGVDVRGLDLPVRRFPEPHMFFGGVGAARAAPDGSVAAVADPRRLGAVRVAGD